MMTTSALLIVNPAARGGEAETLTPAVERLLNSFGHDTVMTTHPGHAVTLAQEAERYDIVVAVGGDGTAHEVVNGLMRISPERRPAFGLIPTGTGNDTRVMLGIPSDLAEAALVLASGVRQRIDVGVCNDTYFSNSFAVGLDARVNARAVECKVTTSRRGFWLYLTSLLHVLFHELAPEHVRITWNGDTQESRDVLITAATIGPTYGGGFRISPHAIPDDGLLDVCVIDPLTLPQALLRLPFVIIGRHTKLKPVHVSLRQSLTIESDTPLPAQTDGEVSVGRRFEISILPQALECIVPQT